MGLIRGVGVTRQAGALEALMEDKAPRGVGGKESRARRGALGALMGDRVLVGRESTTRTSGVSME